MGFFEEALHPYLSPKQPLLPPRTAPPCIVITAEEPFPGDVPEHDQKKPIEGNSPAAAVRPPCRHGPSSFFQKDQYALAALDDADPADNPLPFRNRSWPSRRSATPDRCRNPRQPACLSRRRCPPLRLHPSPPTLSPLQLTDPPFSPQGPIESVSVLIDVDRLRQFRRLSHARRPDQPAQDRIGDSNVELWCFDDNYDFVAVGPSKTGTLGGEVKFGKLLARFLFAVHAQVLSAKSLLIDIADDWLGDMLWGVGRRLKNWRSTVADIIRASTFLNDLVQRSGVETAEPVVRDAKSIIGGYRLCVAPRFLGCIGEMVVPNGFDLHVINKHPEPNAKVTDRDVDELIERDPVYGGRGDRRSELKEIIRGERGCRSSSVTSEIWPSRGLDGNCSCHRFSATA